MLKVWKAPGYLQTQFLPISFLIRNGTIKWIQLKSYCIYPYDSFFKLKYINRHFASQYSVYIIT